MVILKGQRGVGKIPVEVAIISEGENLDPTICLKRTESAIEHYIDMFGSAPFKRYITMIISLSKRQVAGEAYPYPDCNLIIQFQGLPEKEAVPPNAWFYRGGGSTLEHEVFHAWNLFAIAPEGLLNATSREEYMKCPSIWFMQGFTDYYRYLISIMSDYNSEINLYQEMALSWDGYNSCQTPFASSCSNRTEHFCKYHASLIAFLLDLQIRDSTNNQKSLDDVMRSMYEKYGNKEEGYHPNAILETVNEVSGADFSEFFEKYVYGHKDIGSEIDQATKVIGVTITGVPFYKLKDDKVVVKMLPPNSSAVKAGLKKDDVVVGFEGKIRDATITMEYLKDLEVGDQCDILVERDGELERIEFTLEVFKEDPNPSQRALEIRKSLFGEKSTSIQKSINVHVDLESIQRFFEGEQTWENYQKEVIKGELMENYHETVAFMIGMDNVKQLVESADKNDYLDMISKIPFQLDSKPLYLILEGDDIILGIDKKNEKTIVNEEVKK